ncbi:MAG TPA: uL15m family ribosomal protein [Candidatus Thermoplasmatota archaeon]|nr:uL15m family ribosomal protein [Candidatus Thermoplasmatota archaeon]
MVGFKKQRKSSKLRRTRTHGRGKKAGRGAGLRGGRGNAGAHKHKRVQYEVQRYGAEGGYWGREKGFKRPEAIVEIKTVANVSDLDEFVETWVQVGLAQKAGNGYTVNLTDLGVDKLLGAGQINKAITVTVNEAVPRAVEKITAAGGRVVTPTA